MDIRRDLQDVATYLERLIVYAEVFQANNHKNWSHLKNREDYDRIYALPLQDERIFGRIYESGRDIAIHMSYKLRAFNDAYEYPTLSSYIESFKDGWLDEIDLLKELSLNAKMKAEELQNCPWAVGQMIILFEDQIRLLEHVIHTLSILKNSKLYRIENGESMMEKDGSTYNISNVSGRVNIQSHDNSVNNNISVTDSIFEQMRVAIACSDIHTLNP